MCFLFRKRPQAQACFWSWNLKRFQQPRKSSRVSKRILRRGYLYALGFFILVTLAARSQDLLTNSVSQLEFWTTRTGLPHDTVNAILQTRDGFLWVGTAAGLVRFDGLTFQPLSGGGVATQFRRTAVTALCEDHAHHLWIGTAGKGVLCKRENALLLFNESSGLADLNITGICEDATSNLWVATSGGLFHLNGAIFEAYAADKLGSHPISSLHNCQSRGVLLVAGNGLWLIQTNSLVQLSLSSDVSTTLTKPIGAYVESSATIWAFTDRSLVRISDTPKTFELGPVDSGSPSIAALWQAGNGELWIATREHGIYRLENNRIFRVLTRPDQINGEIRALYGDHNGNIWIGTRGSGLGRLLPAQTQRISLETDSSARQISAICCDHAGRLWIATSDGELLAKDSDRLSPSSPGPALTVIHQICSVCSDARGSLWLGTRGQGLWQVTKESLRRLSTADGLSDDNVRVVAPASDGQSLWAGTQDGTLHQIFPDEQTNRIVAVPTRPQPISCLLAETNGKVWIGFEGGGVLCLEGNKLSPVELPRILNETSIRNIFRDSRGHLWFGSWGEGAFCQNGSKWMQLSTSAGLGANTISLIAQDGSGDFWFGSQHSIYQVSATDIELFLGETKSGVDSRAVRTTGTLGCASGWPLSAITPDGSLWAATPSGIVRLGSNQRGNLDSGPPVVLEQILVNGEEAAFDSNKPLLLGPGKHSLDFHFTAISFQSPEKVRFRHKLENFDKDWVDSEDARQAHYGPLPPGHYTFRVTAASAEGVWNQTGTSCEVIVKPPVWRTWWFLSAAGAICVGGIWALARYISERRLRQQLLAVEQRHAMDRERSRIAKDMHDQLGSKLTRISFLSELAQRPTAASSNGLAAKEVAVSARELLASLDALVWAVNPRNDSLENLVGYLDRHAKEYFHGTNIECEVELPFELPAQIVTAEARHNVFRSFEEALNNVLKHSQAHKVCVKVLLKSNAVEIVIQDDGIGIGTEAQTTQRNGLKNMCARMEAIGGICEVHSQPRVGTTVIFRFAILDTKSQLSNKLLAMTPDEHQSHHR